MTERFAVVPLDELVGYAIPGQARWHRIRSTLDVRAFGINAWTATEDGQQIIGEHAEAGGENHEELYIVLAGQATFTLHGEERHAPTGTVVHVPDPEVNVLYNLACANARAGRSEVALEQLGRAVELQASFAEYAQSDEDLASIRDDERFPTTEEAR